MRYLAILSAFIVTIAVATSAKAATETCTVTGAGYVSYANNSSGVPVSSRQFWIYCADGTNYYENINNPNSSVCPQTDVDSVKNFMSLATSGKLSGKTLQIGYNASQTCLLPTGVGTGSFTTNVITYVILNGP